MAEKTVRAGQIWVRRAKRKMRIKMSDQKRLRSFKHAVKNGTGEDDYGLREHHDYRREFLTLDARNKLITASQTQQALKNFTKLEIKERLFTAGIPVPLTYMTITGMDEIPHSMEFLLRNFRGGFVIKPNDGHSGRGITVINKVVGHRFITASGEAWDFERLALHLDRVISGRFSRGRSDIIIVEERVSQHQRLRNLASSGLVDFRLIVSHGYPVMAMARVPTKRSRGKGNLHRGAMGMGISLHDGVLTYGVLNEKPTTKHPDTGMKITGVKIPYWHDLLMTGARAQYFSNITYAGVDMVVDASGTVKVLEVNRRPGLAIQLANRCGMRSRLDYIQELVTKKNRPGDNGHESLLARVEFVMNQDKNGWGNGGES
jgi:alpha-L-glutamate ligase-like protein